MKRRISFQSIWNVSVLIMYATTCSGQLNIDMNPEVFRSDDDGTLFGTSISLNDDGIYVGAPNYDERGGIFRCEIGQTSCDNVDEFRGVCTNKSFW